ncbi:MAG TPA: mannose-1-phosphate guanylyltransferase, partial [Candidatus Brocadiales bacterium]|nr:mannose-1-phosphate guanylyltransferase [Candidatus Brocadiales bacterium]
KPYPLYAVIMAGGSGTRFWPWSRQNTPKQLLNITGNLSACGDAQAGKTMIEQPVSNVTPLVGTDHILIVTNKTQIRKIKKLLPGIPPDNIIAEPLGRDTAPCIGLAAAIIEKRSPSAVMMALPSDHLIRPADKFAEALNAAAKVAIESNALVTFGIKPFEPSVNYGYIHRGKLSGEKAVCPIYEVKGFKEKPDRNTAQTFLDSGEYYWNGGIFVWKTDVILENIARFLPKLSEGLNRISNANFSQSAIAKEYKRFEKISIDYGVMEKANNVKVLEANFEWDDVGGWQALERLHKTPQGDNTVRSKHCGIETSNCIIIGNDKHLIATVGVSDLIIVHTKDATLVCNKHNAEDVKKLVAQLKDKGYEQYL